MKTKIAISFITLICSVFILLKCAKNDKTYVDCDEFSFKETYSFSLSRNNRVFIKGVVTGIYMKDALLIHVIDDLGGNYNDKTAILVKKDRDECCGNYDNLDLYQRNDTLIMILYKPEKDNNCDYFTYPCGSSIIQYSNGYVTGRIRFLPKIETIPWNVLYEELKTNEKPPWWDTWFYTCLGKNHEICYPEPFYSLYQSVIRDNNSLAKKIFVEGIVTEHSNIEYGLKVRPIAHLNDDSSSEISPIVVWGNPKPTSFERCRFDDLRQYSYGDTLLMILTLIDENCFDNPLLSDLAGKEGDYYTDLCGFHVLKSVNDTIIGYITTSFAKEQKMCREEFQKLLNSINNWKP